MRYLPIFCMFAVLLSGCIGTPRSAHVRYFSIVVKPEISPVERTISKSLWIMDFQSAPRYSYRILFRSDAYGIGYKDFDRWVERPEDMVKRVFVEALNESRSFKNVVFGIITKPTDYMLDGYIMDFDEVRSDTAWKAQFSIKVTLYKTLERETIWSSVITSEAELEFNQSGGFAKALSKAVIEAAGEMVRQITAAVKEEAEINN